MSKTRQTYRADHVGSLIAPASLRLARERHFVEKVIDAEEFAFNADEAIRHAVKLQENSGLLAFSDGEFRRHGQSDFVRALRGVELDADGAPILVDRLGFTSEHPLLGEFKALAQSAGGFASKIAIASPGDCHLGMQAIHSERYRDIEALFEDMAQTYVDTIAAFDAAGCRYLQLNDRTFGQLCTPSFRAARLEVGQDPDRLIDHYAEIIARSVAGRADDMVVALHIAHPGEDDEMDQDATARAFDTVFNATGIDLFFVDGRASSHLRLLPGGKQRAMVGFISARNRELERRVDLQRKFDAVGGFVDLDQLGIAPASGFAFNDSPFAVSEDDQRRKLDVCVATAEAIWGGVDK